MKTGLDNIFKGTGTEKAVGQITNDLDPNQKIKLETEPRTNPYEEMELTDDKTNLMKRILAMTGFSTKKDSKKANKASESPAKQSSKKAGSGSAAKSAGKKKAAASKKNEELEVALYTVDKPMDFPSFRYIPDRATVQRLVHRCAALKDGETFRPLGKPNKTGNIDDLLELEPKVENEDVI